MAREQVPWAICSDCGGTRASSCPRCVGMGWLTRADLDKEAAGVFKSVSLEERHRREKARDLEKEQAELEKTATAREIATRVGAAAKEASESGGAP